MFERKLTHLIHCCKLFQSSWLNQLHTCVRQSFLINHYTRQWLCKDQSPQQRMKRIQEIFTFLITRTQTFQLQSHGKQQQSLIFYVHWLVLPNSASWKTAFLSRGTTSGKTGNPWKRRVLLNLCWNIPIIPGLKNSGVFGFRRSCSGGIMPISRHGV